jgi:D-3-phosphoglycerate dehydrogenase
VEGDRNEKVVAGTLFADANPRIVHVNGIDIEAELAPNTLFVTNDDLPGFIGRLGTELGESGVNIATFHLGRKAAGGEAMSMIATDEPVSKEVLKKILSLPLVNTAKSLQFN